MNRNPSNVGHLRGICMAVERRAESCAPTVARLRFLGHAPAALGRPRVVALSCDRGRPLLVKRKSPDRRPGQTMSREQRASIARCAPTVANRRFRSSACGDFPCPHPEPIDVPFADDHLDRRQHFLIDAHSLCVAWSPGAQARKLKLDCVVVVNHDSSPSS